MLTGAGIPLFIHKDRHRRALFVTYGASHIAKVAPVIRELQARGIECLVMALTIGYQKALQLGLKPLGYHDFLGLLGDQAETVLERGRRLLPGNTHPEVDQHETCCYLGINFQEWVDELGEEKAWQRYAERGRHGFLPVRFMGRVLDALQPGVVVATSTPRSEEACIRAAIARHIPTLTMVDLFAPPSDPFLRRPLHADRITVVSEEVRLRFLEAGLGPSQVVVTGSPDFDELFDPSVARAGTELRQRLGWEGNHIVLWAGILEPEGAAMPGPELGIAVERALRLWVKSRQDAALIVRYHPSQYQCFPQLPHQERVYVSDPGAEPIAPILNACEVVIQQVSTVGLQAALLGKRVLHLEFSKWVQNIDFDLSSFGVSEGVSTLQALTPMLNATRQQGTESKMRLPEGPAAPRVASVVMDLLNGNRTH